MISCSANFSWGSWIAAGVGAVVFVAAAPVVVPALGFTSAGIAAGSTGAWMMSLSAGAVAKGTTVALWQFSSQSEPLSWVTQALLLSALLEQFPQRQSIMQ